MMKLTRNKFLFCLTSVIFLFAYSIHKRQYESQALISVEEEIVEDQECRKRISDTRQFLIKEEIKFECNALDSDKCGQNYKRLEGKM